MPFLLQLSLLTKATFDDSDPTPGYMLLEINSIFYSLLIVYIMYAFKFWIKFWLFYRCYPQHYCYELLILIFVVIHVE